MLFVRKQHLGFGWVASLLMLTGAASLGAAVVIQSNRLSELTSDRQLLLRDATRIRAVDALIGQRLPEDWMDGRALHPSGAIVWVVTPRSCPGCLSDLQAWNALAKRGVPTRLVLIGVDDSEARVIAARSRIASAVTVVPGTPLSNGLSFLPSTKVIVSPSGEIAFVDARYPAQACGWDLESSSAMFLVQHSNTQTIPKT